MANSLAVELAPWIPAPLLRLWQRRGHESLLPLQVEAIRSTGLMSGRHVLVAAPSSAGKTLIGEVAVARAVARGRRAIVLTPLRALAEQQAAAYEAGLAGSGLRVLCATADRPEADGPAMAGRFDILVCVPEKLRGWLAADTRPLAGAGTVVIDEIQTLGDPQRGATLDLLITQVLRSVYAPQLVALAPECAQARLLADWLGAELLESRQRPVPLREGVLDLSTGMYRYLERSRPGETAGGECQERLCRPEELARLLERVEETSGAVARESGETARSLVVAVAALAREHGPALLFAPARQAARGWAETLAAMRPGFGCARQALGRLARFRDAGRVVESLARCLQAGVAYHHAELTAELRLLVEEAYQAGEIRILVSTSTLGAGVNLGARSVVQATWRWGSAAEAVDFGRRGDGRADGATGADDPWRRALLTRVALPLGRAAFANQGGRAGRLGYGPGPGRSLLVALATGEAERLWATFLAAPAPAIERAPLAGLNPEELALELLAGGTGRTPVNLAREFGCTFSARLDPKMGEDLKPEAFAAALARLAGAGLARPGGREFWGLTPRGETLLRGPLSPASLPDVLAALDALDDAKPDDWAGRHRLLCSLGQTLEGELALAGLPFGGRRPPHPLPEAADGDVGGPEEVPRGGRASPAGEAIPLSRRETLAWWAASALIDWTDGVPTARLESKYEVMVGALAAAGEAMGRIVFAAAAMERLADARPDDALAGFAERLMKGLRREAVRLGRLRVAGLSRDRMNALADAGLADPVRLAALSAPALRDHLDPDTAEALLGACRRWIAAPLPDAASAGPRPAAPRSGAPTESPARAPLIEIDARSPGIVRAAGRDIQLPPLSFDLLLALAERPGQVVTRQALYHRLWPDGGPEDQQLDAHRRRLIGRLRPILGAQAVRVAEVVRGIGFRLTLGAADVRRPDRGRDEGPRMESGCATAATPG